MVNDTNNQDISESIISYSSWSTTDFEQTSIKREHIR